MAIIPLFSPYLSQRYRGAQSPDNSEPREVIQYARQVIPAAANDLAVPKTGLPHLVDTGSRMLKRIRRLHEDVRRACDQVMRLQQSIDSGLRHETGLFVMWVKASSRGDNSGFSKASSIIEAC
jgi:hypothetical protein